MYATPMSLPRGRLPYELYSRLPSCGEYHFVSCLITLLKVQVDDKDGDKSPSSKSPSSKSQKASAANVSF